MDNSVICLDETKAIVVISDDENDCYLNKSPASNTRSKNKSAARRSSIGSERFNCPICLESYLQRNPCATICGHIFCQQCIYSIVKEKRQCPICKRHLKMAEVIKLYL